jgi:hypothetical protein
MSTKKTVLSTLFVAAIAFAGSTQAQESPVEQIIDQMLKQAMHQVAVELNEEVQTSIIKTAANFDFAKVTDPSLPATTVTITDIAKVAPTKQTDTATTELSNGE